jgi:aminoglycoside phosphotransferase (APT) family kinase protein
MNPIVHPSSVSGLFTSFPVEAQFRPADQAIELDWGRLETYLGGQGYTFNRQQLPRQFAGGLGNLNYLIEINQQQYVLRRPPLGPIPPGANDMAREFLVLHGLWRCYPYAPKSLLFCPNPGVLGAPFLIVEYRPGLIIRGDLPAELQRKAIGNLLAAPLIKLLSELHAIDTASVGLGNFGNPKNFLQRTIENWAKRAMLATDDRPRAVLTELTQWLRANRVLDGPHTLLHSDFKLDNVVLDPQTLEPRAVLDWDMATRGDPLFDLATLLSYWTEADDPPAMHELHQMPTGEKGFPSRREVVLAYAASTGRDVSDFLFYRVLAMFKLGIVFLQLYTRYRAGTTQDERFEGFERLAYGLLEFTHEIVRGRAF